jgi:EAL domain-containing protein (putative c-di-GMP-specific phosphodiesterase class I)
VIAEGIEDPETLAFLHAIDDRQPRHELVIQGGQGYGLGRPAPTLDALTPPAGLHPETSLPLLAPAA